eukprot:scaffold67198_cov50-Attheya_sp.AAC.5
MVEKKFEDEKAIMVQAMESAPDVGSAIDIMEATLANSGFGFQYPTPKNPEAKNKVAGKLLRLPMVIEMGITHAIDTTTATESSIGKVSTIEAALVPGNVVALHSHDQCAYTCDLDDNNFLRISGTEANFGSGAKYIGDLHLAWDFERFLVVDAGNGKISFFSPSHRRFLGCQNGSLTANGYPIASPDDRPRAHEIFQITKYAQEYGSHDYFALFCEIEGKTGSVDGYEELFEVVQIQGFSPESNSF